MNRITYIIAWLWLCFSIASTAQQISSAEYFIDADPGIGNGTEIVLSPDSALNLDIGFATNGLKPGFHCLYVRALDSVGSWGLMHKRVFQIQELNPIQPTNQLVAAEYFIGVDPGIGNATPFMLTPDSNIIANLVIPTNELNQGFHCMYYRTLDSAGVWGLLNKKLIYLYAENPIQPTNQLMAAEYFIDVDPGIGNATQIPFNPDSIIDTNMFVSANNLAPGFHMAYLRAQDSSGIWGLINRFLFYVKGNEEVMQPSQIVGLEYFLQVDTPFHGKFDLALTPDTTINENITVRTLAEESGERVMFFRAVDENGVRGVLTPTDSFTIVECEWVYNTLDSGLGSFRFAVNCVNPGDTIFFDTTVYNQTILLSLPRIDMDKQMYILADTNANITLSNTDQSNTNILVLISDKVFVSGLDFVGKSVDSFLFKLEPEGSLEIIDAQVEKFLMNTPP